MPSESITAPADSKLVAGTQEGAPKLNLNGTFLPESEKNNQPSISQVSAGFEYHIQKLPEEVAIAYANNKK